MLVSRSRMFGELRLCGDTDSRTPPGGIAAHGKVAPLSVTLTLSADRLRMLNLHTLSVRLSCAHIAMFPVSTDSSATVVAKFIGQGPVVRQVATTQTTDAV